MSNKPLARGAACAAVAVSLMAGAPSAQAGCSAASLSGAYGITVAGSIAHPVPVADAAAPDHHPPPPAGTQLAGIGVLTADGNGALTGSLTLSRNGQISPSLSATGSYTVNADCTGTAKLAATAALSINFDFVLETGGAEFAGLVTIPGTVLTITGKHQ